MTLSSRLKSLSLILGLFAALGFALPAAAIDLDQARTQGLIGERPDGLVGAVDSAAPADVKALIETVNAARMAEYRSIAQKNGTPLDAVQAIAGEKQIQKAKQNKWYVMNASGGWSR